MDSELWGRDEALAAGAGFLVAASRSSHCLVVSGGPGIGKTVVWQAVLDRARSAGFRILLTRAAHSEVTLTYVGLTDLLSTVLDETLAELPKPQREALETGLLRSDESYRTAQQRVLATAFLSVVRIVAERGPVLIAIDDMQWLDAASWRVVEFAVRRLDAEPVGVLVTVRPSDRSLGAIRSQVIPLEGLGEPALRQVLRGALGHSFPRPSVTKIARATGGNPFFTIEVGRAMLDRPAEGAGVALPPLPDDLRQLLVRRLRRLPAACQRSLLVAAAQADPVVRGDAAALAPAEQAGIVVIDRSGRLRFTHPLLAAAIYSSAAAPRRRQVHRDLADLATDQEERARHLALGADGPDESVAAELHQAAIRSRRRGAPASAADLLELAISLTPSGGDGLPERLLAAAESHFHAGDRARALELTNQVLAAASTGRAYGHALRLLGLIRYHEDGYPDAVALFERALVELTDDPISVDLWGNLAHVQVSLNDFRAAGLAARRGMAAAKRFGDRAWEASAVAVSAMADVFTGRPPRWNKISAALRLEDPDHQVATQMRPTWIAGAMRLYHDDFAAARELFTALRQRMIDRDEHSDLPFLSFHLAILERRVGNVAEALRYAGEAYELAVELGSDNQQILALGELCYARTTAGDIGAARHDAERGLALAARSDYPAGASLISGAAAFLELSTGRLAEAAALLDPMMAAVVQLNFCHPVATDFVVDAIEAYVGIGRREHAERLIGPLRDAGEVGRRPLVAAVTARCRALVAAARGDLATALGEVEAALERTELLEVPLEAGRTYLLLGQVLRRRRKKVAARDAMLASLAQFERAGALLWSARARAELDRVGIRIAPTNELTPSEQRIAALAASGLTNREIASQGFVSLKTVEANLARVYRKFGVRSRAELVARIRT